VLQWRVWTAEYIRKRYVTALYVYNVGIYGSDFPLTKCVLERSRNVTNEDRVTPARQVMESSGAGYGRQAGDADAATVATFTCPLAVEGCGGILCV